MTVIYHESDADMDVLTRRTIGVIGYGNLGRPIALNLRDSGLHVLVGLREDDARNLPQTDGIPSATISQVAQQADILMLLLPDEVMSQVFMDKIFPHLTRSHTLIFASGYNVAFGLIEPPPFVDVGLIAPRTFGEAVRERYLSGAGFFSFVAAGQDSSGHIWQTILALTLAIGSLKAGAVEITMEQEVELDLFIQQAILPAIHHIMTTAANLLLSRGYPPEAAMMDLYVSGELNDYMTRAASFGMMHALRLSSLTGQFGIFSRIDRFKELKMERMMEITLEEIRKGEFTKEWSREYEAGYPRLRKLLKNQEELDLWELEKQTIEMLNNQE